MKPYPVQKRLKKLSEFLDKEIEVIEVEKKLQGKVRRQIEKVQKEYYLKEKLRAIQEELGEEEERLPPEIGEYRKKIEPAKMPAEVQRKKPPRSLKGFPRCLQWRRRRPSSGHISTGS